MVSTKQIIKARVIIVETGWSPDLNTNDYGTYNRAQSAINEKFISEFQDEEECNFDYGIKEVRRQDA